MKNFLKTNWFKIGILILAFLAIVLFFTLRNKTDNLPDNPLLRTAHATYQNSYYNYSISYPQSWSTSGTSANNDGIVLYTGDGSANISIIASIHQDMDFSNPQAIKSTLLLDDGKVADMAQITSPNQSVLVVQTAEDKDGDFYEFRVSGSRKFFDQNRELLLQVARTLKVK